MPLRVGIVGFGGFGQFLRQSWSGLDEVEVVAVADANPALRPPDLTFYDDWRRLIASPDVDLISIATPPHSHAEMALAAMDAGKHVLVEKPLAITGEDAKRIIQRQAETGVVATVDYMLRFNPLVQLLQDWAHAGPFGRLRRVAVENYAQDESLPRDHWFWDAEVSGGILIEHAVHFIDVVHGCTDPAPVSVDGFGISREDGRVDRMGLTAVYPDGLVMTQYHAFSRPGFFESTSMRFVFDLATVDVEGWIPLSGRVSALVSEENEAELERLPGMRIMRRRPVTEADDLSRPDGWGTTPGNDAGRRSIRSGGVVHVVQRHVEAEFELPTAKSAAYAACLSAMICDVARATHDPGHRLRVTLQDGLSSLDVALRATESARARLNPSLGN